jgi:RES domain-containing protein
MVAWRICKAKHAAAAFDGYGARLYGGRWNSPGKPVVYMSSVASQAFLEMLVHADVTIASLSYVLIPAEFDNRLVKRFDASALPHDWRQDQAVTRKAGDQWLAAKDSLILQIPSAILDIEPNFLINPAHPDVHQLKIGAGQPLIIDERLKKLFAST